MCRCMYLKNSGKENRSRALQVKGCLMGERLERRPWPDPVDLIVYGSGERQAGKGHDRL